MLELKFVFWPSVCFQDSISACRFWTLTKAQRIPEVPHTTQLNKKNNMFYFRENLKWLEWRSVSTYIKRRLRSTVEVEVYRALWSGEVWGRGARRSKGSRRCCRSTTSCSGRGRTPVEVPRKQPRRPRTPSLPPELQKDSKMQFVHQVKFSQHVSLASPLLKLNEINNGLHLNYTIWKTIDNKKSSACIIISSGYYTV